MVIIYNWVGMKMVLLALVVGVVAAKATPEWLFGPGAVAAGIALVVADGTYRWRRGERRMFSPSYGGMLFFVPLWVIGAFIIYRGSTWTRQSWVERRTEQEDRRVHEERMREAATRQADVE